MSKEILSTYAVEPEHRAASRARVFLRTKDSEDVIRKCLFSLGVNDAQFTYGTLKNASRALGNESSPKLLILDVSGVDEPLLELGAVAEVCDPSVSVVAIGDRNDIDFYRELKNAGVFDYFVTPIHRDSFTNACKAVLSPDGLARNRKTGSLVYVLGARGGVGTTTIGTSLAWLLAEEKRRPVVLVDLGLQTGDAALQLDTIPDEALCDALGNPERIDKLLLERGTKHITKRLSLFASLQPLDAEADISEESFLWLLSKLLPSYRLTIVEVPVSVAIRMTWALKIPSTCLLVSSNSLAGARDMGRWSEAIGPDTIDRRTVHIVNHVTPHGGLKPDDFARAAGLTPEISIAYSRDLAQSSALGIKAVQKSASFRRNLTPLLQQLTGEHSSKKEPFLTRLLKRNMPLQNHVAVEKTPEASSQDEARLEA